MSDAATTAPPAPVSAPAPAAPGATVTPIKPHHSAAQPREEGRFAGPPKPGEQATAAPQPPGQAPKEWDVGGYKTRDPDELAAIAAERVVDHDAFQRLQAGYQKLQQQAEAWKDPHRALTPQQRAEIARRELEEFYQREQEAKLPPEQRRILEERRALAAEAQKLREELDRRRHEDEAAAHQKEKAALVADVRAALRILGADENRPGPTVHLVLAAKRAAIAARKDYPPEVIARQVRAAMEAEATAHLGRIAKTNPAALLANPAVVEALNAIRDPAALQVLAPLIDFGRKANLERLGAAPPPSPGAQPTAPSAPPSLPPGTMPRTDTEWQAWFRAGNKPESPEAFQAMQRLRAKDWL